jgi:hypothetical protein
MPRDRDLAARPGDRGQPEARPASVVAPVPPAALRRGGSADATLARSLAGTIGNAAFGRMLLRAPPTAADTATVATSAPGGPLAKLRDELDDTFVDEAACIAYLGQLGPGERTLVSRDATLRRQMIDAFDVDEMRRAVELLPLPVKLQLDWMRKAGSLSKLDAAVFERLLAAAPAADIGELIGWDDLVGSLKAAWKGDPLGITAVRADPAAATGWLATATFATWARERAGAARLAQFVAADAAPRIAALKTSGTWPAFLDALRGDQGTGPARDSLHALFSAATDANDRRALYEIRFATRAAGAVDWIAGGEATWTTQETTSGTGQTTAQVQAAIAAGGPADAAATATADPKGPMAKLRDELDDTFVDEDLCLQLLAELTDREVYLVCQDQAMLGQMASAFDGKEMTRAIGLLRHLSLTQALAFAKRSGDEDDVPAELYRTLVERATSADVQTALQSTDGIAVLKASGVDPLGLGPLATDDAVFTAALANAAYVGWIVAHGSSAALVRRISTRNPLVAVTMLIASVRWNDILDALPTGARMPPADQQALKLLSFANPAVTVKKQLLMKRFNLDAMGQEGGAADFDGPALDQIWVLLERLPPQFVADNKWLEDLNRKQQNSANPANPDGVTGSNRVAVGYNGGQLGANESGAFADPGDQMFGTNMFDNNLIHEMGHAADRMSEFTKDGGPFDTDADLGQWQHHTDKGDLVDSWAGTLNLAAAVPNAADLAGVIDALRWAMNHPAAIAGGVQPAFQQQAGAAWGTAGDPWQARWNAVSGHQIVAQVQQAQAANAPWMTPPAAIGARIYHDTGYNGRWASYLAATRAGGKLSRYQFRDKNDFFAETYSTFYLTPADPGSLVRAWNPRVYAWFLKNVDQGFSTQATP